MMMETKKNDEAKDDVAPDDVADDDDGDSTTPSLSQISPVSWQETKLSAGRTNQYCPPYRDDPIAVAPVVVQDKQQEPPRKRPDRISITIHYEEDHQQHDDNSPEVASTRTLGIIWNDQTGVIIGLHHTGILILPNENPIPSILLSKEEEEEGKDDSLIHSSKLSTTTSSTFSSLLQIGDRIVRVNGVPWCETVAHEVQSHAARIGSLVFEIDTRSSSSSSSSGGNNTRNEKEAATMKDPHDFQHENNNATDEDTTISNRRMKEYEQSDGCTVDTTFSSLNLEHGAKTPSPTSVTVSTTPLVEEQKDKTMIHQAIVLLPKTYTGDYGLSLRMGDGPTPRSTMIRTMSDLWKYSVISPNQRILAIGPHHWNTITSCHDGYQYLKQGVQLRRLSITTLATPTQSPNWTLRKAVVGITGGAMLGVGAVLFVSPLHPVGHAMVIGGGIVLGTEFEGPKKAMSYSQEKFRSTKNQLLDSFRRRRRRRSQNDPNIQPEEKEEKQQPTEQQVDRP